jgi:transposase
LTDFSICFIALMHDADAIKRMKLKFLALGPLFNERLRRQWAAAEAIAYGWGGVQAVSQATGLSPNTIRKGQWELAARGKKPHAALPQRLRRAGGGRKRKTISDPELSATLEALVDPATRGDPESPLRWTCKSTYTLARELTKQGHPVSARTVGRLLRAAGYSLQGNRKTKEGGSHPDRNAQFEHIKNMVKRFQRHGQPVISVDTKKKELVGDFKNGGREWQPRGAPEEVRVHDFLDKKLGKAIPYGVYDLTHNQGWVSVGIDHATAQFATAATQHGLRIRAELDRREYPTGTKVSAAELQDVKLKPHSFHGNWNYTISPAAKKNSSTYSVARPTSVVQ